MGETSTLAPWAIGTLRDIEERARLIRELQALNHEDVARLRSGACPWSAIGDALGLSTQGAQQKYGR